MDRDAARDIAEHEWLYTGEAIANTINNATADAGVLDLGSITDKLIEGEPLKMGECLVYLMQGAAQNLPAVAMRLRELVEEASEPGIDERVAELIKPRVPTWREEEEAAANAAEARAYAREYA